jgi:hypothetical protein
MCWTEQRLSKRHIYRVWSVIKTNSALIFVIEDLDFLFRRYKRAYSGLAYWMRYWRKGAPAVGDGRQKWWRRSGFVTARRIGAAPGALRHPQPMRSDELFNVPDTTLDGDRGCRPRWSRRPAAMVSAGGGNGDGSEEGCRGRRDGHSRYCWGVWVVQRQRQDGAKTGTLEVPPDVSAR